MSEDIREAIRQSAPNLDSLIESQGLDEAYRGRIWEMARNGDLLLLRRFLLAQLEQYGNDVLSPIEAAAREQSYGAIMGIRGLWWDLLRLAQGDMEKEPPTSEMNTFTHLEGVEALEDRFYGQD